MPEIREAKEEDRESTIRVLWKAFDATQTLDHVLKEDWVKKWNRPEKDDWAYIAVDGKKVVANLSFFASENNMIRGKPVRFAGVWAVATEPSYRRAGLVRGLFDKALPRMKEEGCVLSILDPFYRPFYEKFGYAIAEKRAKHVFKQEHLRIGKTSDKIVCREAESKEDADKVQQVERSMARYGSRFFMFRDTIEEMVKKGHFHLFEKDDEPVGTVWFSFSDAKPGIELTVGLTRYTHDEVFPSIVEQVRNHAVNTKKISWYAEIDAPVRHFFSSVHFTESFQFGSMMMRVIDFEGYCKSISIPEESTQTVVLELKDDQCPWNTGVYKVIPSDGSLNVETSSSDPDIVLTPYQLSEIISGITPANRLREYDEIECSKETAMRLESIFPEDVFYSYVRF
ncbi:MAG: GNAT family N-acetyltransferase [Candidatus Thorarchaeota archaeon]|nr:GNAT family N-acetyltransferase [Candidatus Thorarchaeota archaeon]